MNHHAFQILNIAPEADFGTLISVPICDVHVGEVLKDFNGNTYSANSEEIGAELSDADIDALAEIFDLLARCDAEQKKFALEADFSSFVDGEAPSVANSEDNPSEPLH